MKNAAHLDNFVSAQSVRMAIVDVGRDPARGTTYWEIASGKTEAEARERFHSRFLLRPQVGTRNDSMRAAAHVAGDATN